MKKWMCIALASFFPLFGNDVPKLTLSATGTIRKPADELQLKVGVITLGATAQEALQENSGKMQEIVAKMEWAGLTKDDYETSQFSINPVYSPYPVNPPPNWKQSIIGYEATNTILIHTEKLELIGKVIDLANKAGANSITDIKFGLRSSRDFWSEALTAAGANAMSDARAIARATGVRLVRVLSISLNQAQVKSPHLNMACLAKAVSCDAAPPIEAGEVAIEANVTVVYEIE